MEAHHPPLHREKRLSFPSCQPSLNSDSSDEDNFVDALEFQVDQNSPTSSKDDYIYYALLLLKVGLWLVFAWALSYLHLGAPCFLLPVILWLYKVPMQRALDWAKRRLKRSS